MKNWTFVQLDRKNIWRRAEEKLLRTQAHADRLTIFQQVIQIEREQLCFLVYKKNILPALAAQLVQPQRESLTALKQ